MIAVVPISVTIVIAYNGELKLSLGELGREFPIADPQILLGDEPPEGVSED
jgi:hypothetical protein